MRIGHGYDVHRFAENRRLVLGGVAVPYELGLLGHSDADVLLHAVCDALLGAAALGDIGKHFPDNCEQYKNIDSRILLRNVVALLKEKGYGVGNIDATVIAQKPKLAPYISDMVKNIADDCGIPCENVNVKATTEEGLGFTGELLGISSHAVCIIYKLK
ncbi:MAG: 2-C-methyl-D-erythritol 2,4-cyclodiphosphate synthase [Clostridia bacterium]|nr:2-C-methyl-D-erythritol 2,4-cyclodiphosphate synthase [Clostridia bacterium]